MVPLNFCRFIGVGTLLYPTTFYIGRARKGSQLHRLLRRFIYLVFVSLHGFPKCLAFSGGDKPYLISGADDKTVKVRDIKFQYSYVKYYLYSLSERSTSDRSHNSLQFFLDSTVMAVSDRQVWDYQARTCVQTLGEHTHNVSCVAFHPDLPIIITGAEDGSKLIVARPSLQLG